MRAFRRRDRSKGASVAPWRQSRQGVGSYFAREAAELALLVAGLFILRVFVPVPIGVLVGLPVAKAIVSVGFYALFLRKAFERPARPEAMPSVGQAARAISPLRPEGQVKANGEIWSARSEDGRFVAEQTDVEVVGRRGNLLRVVPLDPDDGRPGVGIPSSSDRMASGERSPRQRTEEMKGES